VKIPIKLDDFPLFKSAMPFSEWERRLIAEIENSEFLAFRMRLLCRSVAAALSGATRGRLPGLAGIQNVRRCRRRCDLRRRTGPIRTIRLSGGLTHANACAKRNRSFPSTLARTPVGGGRS
jgi:hypothetical protein